MSRTGAHVEDSCRKNMGVVGKYMEAAEVCRQPFNDKLKVELAGENTWHSPLFTLSIEYMYL
jgi:hypothetical protein